eukprot:876926-Amphidinium_carterae.1
MTTAQYDSAVSEDPWYIESPRGADCASCRDGPPNQGHTLLYRCSQSLRMQYLLSAAVFCWRWTANNIFCFSGVQGDRLKQLTPLQRQRLLQLQRP